MSIDFDVDETYCLSHAIVRFATIIHGSQARRRRLLRNGLALRLGISSCAGDKAFRHAVRRWCTSGMGWETIGSGQANETGMGGWLAASFAAWRVGCEYLLSDWK